jgi:hypothetical protein
MNTILHGNSATATALVSYDAGKVVTASKSGKPQGIGVSRSPGVMRLIGEGDADEAGVSRAGSARRPSLPEPTEIKPAACSEGEAKKRPGENARPVDR